MWDTLILISQYIQQLMKNVWLSLLMSQKGFTKLTALDNFSISLGNTLNGTNNTTTIYALFLALMPWISWAKKHTQQAENNEDNASWAMFLLWQARAYVPKLPRDKKGQMRHIHWQSLHHPAQNFLIQYGRGFSTGSLTWKDGNRHWQDNRSAMQGWSGKNGDALDWRICPSWAVRKLLV